MKIYVKAARAKTLSDYVGLPFDLSNQAVMFRIAEWAGKKLVTKLKRKSRIKTLYADDISASPSRKLIHVGIMNANPDGDDEYMYEYTLKIGKDRFGDDVQSYDDVQRVIEDSIDTWIVENTYY